ncbi:MAG TPA: DUF58 domain-containing protein [Thermomicrobiales bacterium]|nr:DUF58 domain-containing protein [Thermomicrobiales bacterium]
MAGLRLLIVSIGALVWGISTDWPAVTLVASCALLMTAIAWLWSRWCLSGIAFSRRVTSDKLQVGDVLTERLRLENRSAVPKLFIELDDHTSLISHRANRVVGMAGHSAREWDAESVVREQGRHRLGPVSIRSGDPIGLFRRVRRITGAIDITVYPLSVPLDQYSPMSALQSGGGVIQRRSTIPTATVGGIRDYTIGDSINRISWTATARAGHLMVKEFEIDPTADLWVVLDLYALTEALTTPSDWDIRSDNQMLWLGNTFEYRIMLTCSLVRRTLELGRSVGLVINAPQTLVLSPERSDRQFVRILEALAVAQPVPNATLLDVLSGTQHRFARDSAVVAITSHPTDEVASLLGHLRRRTISPELVIVGEGMQSADVPFAAVANRIPCYRLTRFDNPAIALNSALLFASSGGVG